MKIDWIDYQEITQLSRRDRDYIAKKKELRPFIQDWPSMDNFEKAMSLRAQFPVDRIKLVSHLKNQYSNIKMSEKTLSNIEKLSEETTFTVTTAHQLSLLTGPLYYIYKICSIINLSNLLNQQYPEYDFIPVFVSGGEDHDFEEINHLHLFGKTISWQSDQTGSTGKMNTEGLQEVLDEVRAIFGNQYEGHSFFEQLNEILRKSKNYADFGFRLVNELFGQYGVVYMDASSPLLKSSFADVFQEDILNNSSKTTVSKTIDQLETIGYKQQAFPREINTFYLGENSRERIVFEDGLYKVNNTNITFTTEEIKKELIDHPECFSPNVVLRPMYQESILPNLAYIGGGGELAYWLERKAQFEAHNIYFPLLIRRNSAMWVSGGNSKNAIKNNISIADLFEDEDVLVKKFVKETSDNTLTLSNELDELEAVFLKIAEKAKSVQASLENKVMAENAKLQKTIQSLESKLIKFEKDKFEVETNRLRKLKGALFPGNGLQERYDNFLPIYLKHGSTYLDFLIENLDPLRPEFAIITE